MSGTTMVVFIVLISVGFGVLYDMYNRHMSFKEKMLKRNANADEQNSALEQQVQQLSERVATLEKIVTDEGYSVQKEIDQL